jgi:hypothetical protein
MRTYGMMSSATNILLPFPRSAQFWVSDFGFQRDRGEREREEREGGKGERVIERERERRESLRERGRESHRETCDAWVLGCAGNLIVLSCLFYMWASIAVGWLIMFPDNTEGKHCACNYQALHVDETGRGRQRGGRRGGEGEGGE